MQDKTTLDREKPPTEAKSHIAQEIEALGPEAWLEQFRAVFGSTAPAHEMDRPQKRFMQCPPLELYGVRQKGK